MYHLELRQEEGALDFFLYSKVVDGVQVSKYIDYE